MLPHVYAYDYAALLATSDRGIRLHIDNFKIRGLPDPGDGEIFFKFYVDQNNDKDFNDPGEIVTSKVYDYDVGLNYGPLNPEDSSGNELIVSTGQRSIKIQLEVYDQDLIFFNDDLLYLKQWNIEDTDSPFLDNDSSEWIDITWSYELTIPPEIKSITRNDIETVSQEYEEVIKSRDYSEGKGLANKIENVGIKEWFLLPETTAEYEQIQDIEGRLDKYHGDAVEKAKASGALIDPDDLIIVIMPKNVLNSLKPDISGWGRQNKIWVIPQTSHIRVTQKLGQYSGHMRQAMPNINCITTNGYRWKHRSHVSWAKMCGTLMLFAQLIKWQQASSIGMKKIKVVNTIQIHLLV